MKNSSEEMRMEGRVLQARGISASRSSALHYFFVFALLFTACSSGPTLSRLSGDDVILAFGDSLTYGFGAAEGFSYPAELERLTGLTVINAGVNGENTEQGRKRLPSTLDLAEPKLLILCMGGNDFLQHQEPAATEENLQAMIREAKQRRIDVLLLGVPRPRLLLKADPVYEVLADAEQVPLEQKALPKILSKRQLKSDTIHPNAEGYAILAERIYETLQKHGAL